MSDNNLMQTALKYASYGWPVLPLKPGEKTPLTPKGFKDASTDETAIKARWTKTPDANVGIRVGPESNLLVLDVDNKNGKNGSASLWELRNKTGSETVNTRTETTPHGFHLYYSFPDELKGKRLKAEIANGIDLKHKGYVVAAPSALKDGKQYQDNGEDVADFPASWIELCIKQEPTHGRLDANTPLC